MSVIDNLIVISLFVNELNSNLVQEVKIRSLFIPLAQQLTLFIICCNGKTLTPILVNF